MSDNAISNNLYADCGASWRTSYTDRLYFPGGLKYNQICIEDIAHSLAMQCRFNGHCKQFYSYAEHCIFVSSIASNDKVFKHYCQQREANRLDAAMLGLLHDAPKAYLGRVPIGTVSELSLLELGYKHTICSVVAQMTDLRKVICCVNVANVIARLVECRAFGLTTQLPAGFQQQHIDLVDYFYDRQKIHLFKPEQAERMYLGRFKILLEDMA